MAASTNFLALLKARVQVFRTALQQLQSVPQSTESSLHNLLRQFAQEFSERSPGFFPGQIGPQRLMDYHNHFTQHVPGFDGRRPVKVQAAYVREVLLRLRELMDMVYTDLKNPKVKIPWLAEKLGRLFIRDGTVRGRLIQYIEEKSNNLERALRS
ncbi:MAG: hypothetical protein ACD_44C00290G0004 [uncultured bacterium]|nr:MAG: hypothetical protein ACD_44C00290G0004 [uncultured bacterium]OGT24869.1 MAG: hypothetical protein A2W47_07425 [Gammaproteobacteria bacterium RIFCSPHIGHO2_12_38_15]OGT69098.1 MAG: hypothetical protein A3I12_06000 [Gammaproteobacteria bacterium RIFCSPLOWO2_02_FULL_38_11]OGT76480.1 MAG: hypothetical protein A3G71_05680 [Gammaproteobacteria bacterium RIFCSPLOWO2_12_FULL_38_14]